MMKSVSTTNRMTGNRISCIEVAITMYVPIRSFGSASTNTIVIANYTAGDAPLPCPVPWNGSSGVQPYVLSESPYAVRTEFVQFCILSIIIRIGSGCTPFFVSIVHQQYELCDHSNCVDQLLSSLLVVG